MVVGDDRRDALRLAVAQRASLRRVTGGTRKRGFLDARTGSII
jgi:hypothetical protein